VSNQECTEIVQKARRYLRAVRNVADNRDLDADLARLERGCKHRLHSQAGNVVVSFAEIRQEAAKTPRSGVARPAAIQEARKDPFWNFLVDLGVFACFACLLCSLCSLVGLP